jgi:hypothetical protein
MGHSAGRHRGHHRSPAGASRSRLTDSNENARLVDSMACIGEDPRQRRQRYLPLVLLVGGRSRCT